MRDPPSRVRMRKQKSQRTLQPLLRDLRSRLALKGQYDGGQSEIH